jgi:hypothetical protein
MTAKELIVREMEAVPEPVLTEVLDFLRFLKAKRAEPGQQVTVVSAEGEMSVPLTALAAQDPRIAEQITATPMPVNQMCDELRQALDRGGYTSREHIVGLVREVKQEILKDWLKPEEDEAWQHETEQNFVLSGLTIQPIRRP